jgi:hypothetical protein
MSMPTKGNEPPHASPSARELVGVAFAMLAFLLVQLAVSNAFYLFKRRFWIDEWFAASLAVDPDLGHALRSVAMGYETNAPLLCILQSTILRVTHATPEIALRGIACVSVWLALLGIYAVLRRRETKLVAITAILAIWCHPLLQTHAFEARYYGPWLAAFAWFYIRFSDSNLDGPLRKPMLVLLAAFICAIHYFGVISLVALLVGTLWMKQRPSRTAFALTLLGIALGLLSCVPFLLGQRSFSTSKTWMDPFKWSGMYDYFASTIPFAFWIGLLPWLYDAVPRWWKRKSDLREDGDSLFWELGGLVGLVVFVVLFSWLIFPIYISRYSIVVLMLFAVAIARLLSGLPPASVACIALLLAGFSGQVLYAQTNDRNVVTSWGWGGRIVDKEQAQLGDYLEAHPEISPIVVPHILLLPDLVWYHPALKSRLLFSIYDDPTSKRDSQFAKDWARVWDQQYAKGALVAWKDLVSRAPFYIVPFEDQEQALLQGNRLVYAGYEATMVAPHVYRLDRSTPKSEAPTDHRTEEGRP